MGAVVAGEGRGGKGGEYSSDDSEASHIRWSSSPTSVIPS